MPSIAIERGDEAELKLIQVLKSVYRGVVEDRSIFPFELVSRYHPHRNNLSSSIEFFNVWVLDCLDRRYISHVFQFIRSHLTSNHSQLKSPSLKHLKSIHSIPRRLESLCVFLSVDSLMRLVMIFAFSEVHLLNVKITCSFMQISQNNPIDVLCSLIFRQSGERSHGVSILLTAESVISYKDLTDKLLNFNPLRGLILISTPYRVKVPRTGPTIAQKESGQLTHCHWPLVDSDPDQIPFSGTMQSNQRILKREWKAEEVQWIFDGLLAAVESARSSKEKDGQLGVGCLVSSFSLDPPEEIAHLVAKTRSSTLYNPPLATATDVRVATGNPLRHAFVELIHKVSHLDCLQPRIPESPLHPIPYLLTNLVVFATHEPCLLCSMALLHSRIKHLFFLIPSPKSGGCGSVYNVHEQDGLNHKFFVWRLRFPINQELKHESYLINPLDCGDFGFRH
ncbi:hypothetical protein O181_073766 [Austropuccinia psidii MF-1]|uniref:CMP/dCMP-type deaminase domain-containing protein n=1 Tax=Austropuccinia psidii MF-1 TaxID=1389203 RepID=A0A9Q3FBR9_9BASI|nr:hypothetical protein [Austropuccinia psidii MF-1]